MLFIQHLTNEFLANPDHLGTLEFSPSARLANEALGHMLDSLTGHPVILEFIHQHVTFSFEAMANVVDGKLVPHIKNSFSTLQSMKDQMAGVYMLFNHLGIDTYIGSTIDMSSRLPIHFDAINLGLEINRYHEALLSNSSVAQVYWSYIYRTVNYLTLFKELNPHYSLSIGEVEVLKALTDFVPRFLEQGLLNEFAPNLNNLNNAIKFLYTSWDPAELNNYFVKVDDPLQAIEIRNLAGELIRTCPSFQDAADFLNCNLPKIRRYINNANGFRQDSLGYKITLGLVGAALLPQLKLPGGPLTELGGYVVWAFYPDKQRFLGPFASLLAAYKALNPVTAFNNTVQQTFSGTDNLLRYRNLEHLVSTEKGEFYIAINPIKQPSNKRSAGQLPKAPFAKK